MIGHVATIVAAVEAVAVAAWLVPASVHIVHWSASGPARVALFAPRTRLIWFAAMGLAAAVALLAWGRTEGRAAQLRPIVAPFCLLWLWTVPYLLWLPDRLPMLLVLAGPIRWVIGGIAVAGAARVGQRLHVCFADERRVPGRRTIFAASFVLYLLFGVASSRAIGPGGDEPHYLIISQSLLADGDLQIENNHQHGEYRQFFGGTLRPDFLRRGQDGQIYSIHAPGLPVLVLPAYAAGGYRAVVVFMCLLAALAAIAVFDLAAALAGRRAALVAWAAVCLTVPFMPHAWLVFPEIPAALVVAWAALWLWQPIEQRASTWVWRGLALGLLVWLHTKFVILLVLFAAALFVRIWRRPKTAAAFAAPIVLCIATWLYFFYTFYGVINPEAPYGDYMRTFVLIRNMPRGLLGLLFDQKFGLLFYSPIYLLALAGSWLMMRRPERRYVGAVLLLVTAAYVGSTTRLYMWWGGSSAPARFLVPILPCLAPMIALAVKEIRHPVMRALTIVWLSVSIGAAFAGVAWPERLLLFSEPHGRARLLVTIQAGSPLALSFPTFTTEEWQRALGELGPWLLAGVLGILAMVAVARQRMASALWLGAVGSLTFLLTAGVATGRAPDVREDTSRRGALDLIWRFDGDRLRGFEYGRLRQIGSERLKELSTIVFPGAAGGAATPAYAAGSFALPAGVYEARVWFAGQPRAGEVLVTASDRLVFGRAVGPLNSPTVVPFELPVATGRLAVRVPDAKLVRTVTHVEVAPVAVVPQSAREEFRVRTIESITSRPGAYLVYVDERTYPEGGVFWTRDTERATVLVAPAGASRMVMTLHLGPLSGDVRVSVAGKETAVHVQPNDTTAVEFDVPGDLRLVPITIQAPGRFRPAEVDPSATDMRRLGCQVRIDLA